MGTRCITTQWYSLYHWGASRSGPHFHPATKAHPGLLVSDLQSILRTCREHGLEIADAEPLAGFERVYVYDPFGNRLELMEPNA
jgi:hypothetical protein